MSMRPELEKHIATCRFEIHDLDKEKLWDSIEASLHKKKRRFGYVWWIGIAASALAIGLLFDISNDYDSSVAVLGQMVDLNSVEHMCLQVESPPYDKKDSVHSFIKLTKPIKSFPLVSFKLDSDHKVVKSLQVEEVITNAKKQLLSEAPKVLNKVMAKPILHTGLIYTRGVPIYHLDAGMQSTSQVIIDNKEIRASLGFVTRTAVFQNRLTNNNPSELGETSVVNVSTQGQMELDFGMRFRYKLSDGILLESGMVFSQWNERLTYESANFETVEVVTSLGEATVTTLVERKVRHSNHLRYLQIPLKVHYSRKLSKAALNFHAGLSYSRLVDFDGLVYQGDELFVQAKGLNNLVQFHKRDNVLASVGVHYSRSINDYFEIELSTEIAKELMNNLNSSKWTRTREALLIGVSVNYQF